MLRERIITIDLDEGNYRILRYKQYDNNQILKIIIQENKEEVDLAFYTARLFFKLPSGSILEKDTTIENNRIIVSIDSGILSENGRIIADLTLSSSEQLVTAFTMYLDVEETIDRNEAVQSKPEWDLITNTLNNLDTKVDKVEGKSLIANSEIERLANVDNYDDTELRNLIDTKSDTTHNHDTQYASKSSEHIHDNKNALDKVTDSKVIEWDNKSDFSGSYEDLTDKPTIPVVDVNKVYVDEQLSNKSDINHTHTELHTHNNKDVLDVITQEKINEWNSKSDFSGDYNDLINKPIIPTLDGYATENYVKNAIADAQLNGGGGGGTGSIDLSGYATKDELNAKANVSDIPTKTSQLENDSNFLTSVPSEYVTETELNSKGYLTEHQDISGKADKSEIPTKLSQLQNDSNFINSIPNEYVTEAELESKGYLTEHQDLSNYQTKEDNSLTTDAKMVTGAINELNTNCVKLGNDLDNTMIDIDENILTKISSLESELNNKLEINDLNNYYNKTEVDKKIIDAVAGGAVDLSDYAKTSDIPTKTSDLVNDSGFLTSIPNEYITETELDAKGYLIEHQDISGKANKSYVDTELAKKSDKTHTHSYNDLSDKPTIPSIDGLATKKELTDGLAKKSDTTHTHDQYLTEHQDLSNYALKTELPTVPTKVSQLQNDKGYLTSVPSEYVTETELASKGYLTEHQDISGKADKVEGKGLSTNDLTNGLKTQYDTAYSHSQSAHAPINAEANVQSDWNETDTSSDAYILNKPIIPNKTSQLTNDSGYLTSIPSEYVTETELESKGYLTQHQDLSDYALKTEIPTVPTKTSQLQNDSSYATESYVTNKIAEAKLEQSNVDLSGYQTKEDNALETTNKTVVGAINEVNTNVMSKANKSEIPTKTSQLINNSGYLTQHQDISSKADKNEIPTNVSQLTNDSGYLTSIPNEYITESELNSKGYLTEHQDISGKADKSEIPTKTSQLTNNSGFLTSIPSEYVTESELNAKGFLTEVPSEYITETELANKGYLTEHQDISSKADKLYVDTELAKKSDKTHTHSQYLTEHQDISNKADKSEIPTKTSQLTNDSGYLTSVPSEYVTESELNAKGYATTSQIPTSLPANGGNASTVGGYKIWVGTQSQYDAIATKSSTTIYLIKE